MKAVNGMGKISNVTARLATKKAVFRPALPSRPSAGLLPEKNNVATKRKGIGKKTRFEVFKRDSFKCQYCGKGAPEVILRLDHIQPVSKGGKNELLNLITACFDCNAGKSNIELTDATAIAKQREQLEVLNERREQLEMLLKWRQGLSEIQARSLEALLEAWMAAAPGWHLNEAGEAEARKLLVKYGLDKVLDAIEIAKNTYIKTNEGKATADSVQLAWKKLSGILSVQSQPKWRQDCYYIRGILRNRLSWVNEREAMRLLEEACAVGLDTEYLKRLARDCRNWYQFEQWVEESIAEERGDGAGEKH